MPAKMRRTLTHTADWNKLRILETRTCRDGERFGRLQILDDGAEIYRFGINCPVFRDLRPIQHFESVALEHFLSPPTFKCNDLTVDAFFAGAVEITQIRAHQGARC